MDGAIPSGKDDASAVLAGRASQAITAWAVTL
jgi:hypothetical protein